MSDYLSPKSIQEIYKVGRSTAYKLLSEYERHGGEVIHIGRITRVSDEIFTEFLKGKTSETKS